MKNLLSRSRCKVTTTEPPRWRFLVIRYQLTRFLWVETVLDLRTGNTVRAIVTSTGDLPCTGEGV